MSRKIEVGSQVGPYRVTGELGAGAAGTVYSAENEESGEKVALKTLQPNTAVDEEIHRRFIREIAIAQKLRDPHVVGYRDCGLHDELLYYAMELVPWGSLSDVLEHRQRLPWREVAECGIQICQGLQHLHEARIVHRDLKPANIFLSDDGRLKLGDFGLAKDLTSFRLTVEGKTVGTGTYLAPEQATADEKLDGRCDLYALGCILFEMVTGRPPFVCADPHSGFIFFELMKKHVEETPPRISDCVPGVPEPLVELVDKLLAKSPDARPQSARDVATCLAAILRDPTAPLVVPESGATAAAAGRDAEDAPRHAEPPAGGTESPDGGTNAEKLLTERLREDAPERRVRMLPLMIALGIAIVALIGAALVMQN